jgi:hypothetical protein
MEFPTIRVRARGEGPTLHIDHNGKRSARTRLVGRDDAGAILLEGELVADHAFYRKAIRTGALELVQSTAPAQGAV